MSGLLAAPNACRICFEEPDLYGLLLNCTHQYCYYCVKRWRRPQTQNLEHDGPSRRQAASSNVVLMRNLLSLGPASGAEVLSPGANLEGLPADSRPLVSQFTNVMSPLLSDETTPEMIREFRNDRGAGPPEQSGIYDMQDPQNGPTQGERSRLTCPLCSEPSDHVVPSVVFPATEEAKKRILAGFLAEKKRILCRDFERHINDIEGFYCPRFNDCIYAHLQPVEEPNSQMRDTPFIFSEARIAQLRARPRHRPFAEALVRMPMYMCRSIESVIKKVLPSERMRVHYSAERALIQQLLDNFTFHRHEIATCYLQCKAQAQLLAREPNLDLLYSSGRWIHNVSDCWRVYDGQGRFAYETRDAEHAHGLKCVKARPDLVQWTRDPTGFPRLVVHVFLAPAGVQIVEDRAHKAFVNETTRHSKHAAAEEVVNFLDPGVEKRMYHIFSDMGQCEATSLQTPNLRGVFKEYATDYTEFTDPITRNMYEMGTVTHHFLSPISRAEAADSIVPAPPYQGLLCAIEHETVGSEHFEDPFFTALASLVSYKPGAEDDGYNDEELFNVFFDGIEDEDEDDDHRFADNDAFDDIASDDFMEEDYYCMGHPGMWEDGEDAYDWDEEWSWQYRGRDS